MRQGELAGTEGENDQGESRGGGAEAVAPVHQEADPTVEAFALSASMGIAAP